MEYVFHIDCKDEECRNFNKENNFLCEICSETYSYLKKCPNELCKGERFLTGNSLLSKFCSFCLTKDIVKCKECNNKTKYDRKTGNYYLICKQCYEKKIGEFEVKNYPLLDLRR